MDDVIVFDHALKHGLDEDQILHAWRNAVDSCTVVEPDGQERLVAIGPDQAGRMLELTAAIKPWGYLIYHANTPPTPRTLRNLEIEE